MSLTIVGSIAFDSIETPYGKAERIVGGAGSYIAWATTLLVKQTNIISVIGGDFPKKEMAALEKRGANIEGIEVREDEKSFFWAGKYHNDMNSRDTLTTDLNVLANFQPKVPVAARKDDYLLLGNLNPSVQLSVLNQMEKKPKLIAMDTMNFWMDSAPDELQEVISKVDVLLINDSEARQLSGVYPLVKAARKIFEMGPKFLVIKKGAHGALLFHKDQIFSAPALPLDRVTDPTGAGDTFAGGFIGYLAEHDNPSFEGMKSAIIVGSALASFCVQEFGVEGLRKITMKDLKNQVNKFVELARFDAEI